MLKITDNNYEIYKQIFEIIWVFEATRLMNIDPNVDYSPIAVLNSWEQRSKSLAKRGLKEGLRDTLTMLLDMPNDLKMELSKQLMEKGLPNLYQLISTIKDTPQKVLKRGKIKNLDEYYVIKEFLVDMSSELSTDDRNRLDSIFFEFENNYGKPKSAK